MISSTDFPAPRIGAGHRKARARSRKRFFSHDIERGHADKRQFEREREPPHEGKPHALAGERSRPRGDAEPFERSESEARMAQHEMTRERDRR